MLDHETNADRPTETALAAPVTVASTTSRTSGGPRESLAAYFGDVADIPTLPHAAQLQISTARPTSASNPRL